MDTLGRVVSAVVIAIFAGVVAGLLLRNSALVRLVGMVHQWFWDLWEAVTPPPGPPDYVKRLLRFLKGDQASGGSHTGQFGRSTNHDDLSGYAGEFERSAAKPRMWLTSWPVLILVEHRDLPSVEPMLRLVQRGITKLLDDCWIRAATDAAVNVEPWDGLGVTRMISYRHTICAGQMLLTLDTSSVCARRILSRMLDPGIEMQVDNGGWRGYDKIGGPGAREDLWASAYAARYLHTCSQLDHPRFAKDNAPERIQKALLGTLTWLDSCWDSTGWQYGELPPEETVPGVLNTVWDAAMAANRPEVLRRPLDFVDNCTESGYPSQTYIEQTSRSGPLNATIRLAYTYFRAKRRDGSVRRCRLLTDYALDIYTTKPVPLYSSEAAMLLDIVLHQSNA